MGLVSGSGQKIGKNYFNNTQLLSIEIFRIGFFNDFFGFESMRAVCALRGEFGESFYQAIVCRKKILTTQSYILMYKI